MQRNQCLEKGTSKVVWTSKYGEDFWHRENGKEMSLYSRQKIDFRKLEKYNYFKNLAEAIRKGCPILLLFWVDVKIIFRHF